MRLDKKRNNFWLTVVIIPLFIALAGVLFHFIILYFLQDKKGIQYSVEGPIKFYDANTNGIMPITIGNNPIPYFFGYKLQLWNSGNCPLGDLHLRSAFQANSKNFKNFKIFSINRDENSEIQFGSLKLESSSQFQPLVYKAFNQGVNDTILFLTNDDPKLKIVSDTPGVTATPFIRIEEILFKNLKFIIAFFMLGLWLLLMYLSFFISLRSVHKKINAYSKTTLEIHNERKQLYDFDKSADEKKMSLFKKFEEKIQNIPKKEL